MNEPIEPIEPIVEMIDVQKLLNKQTIVDSVNLSVKQGEVLALCGANGAGKSTLLRLLVGIMQPTKGTIRIKGMDWKSHRKEYAGLIGYMPDDYRFGNGLTARETLSFWASIRGLPVSRADEVLAEVGLADTGKKPVSSFSKGMRQRVLFAQAMLARPPVMVLDEPTNGLDPFWMSSFITLIHSLREQGHTIIFSTHQIQIAEALADHAVFMNLGRIEMDDTTENIRASYGSRGLHDAFAGLFGI